jgi:hypothetical protein
MTGYHVKNGSVTFRRETGSILQMRLVYLLIIPGALSLYGQVCPPARILPSGAVNGRLDDSSCFLSDSTAYSAYRLDLPTRGEIEIALSTSEDFLLVLRDNSGAKLDSGATIGRPIEAGSYTLLVNARVPGQAGQYSVRTSFTAEPGTLCAGFPSLGLSQTVSGILGSSGCTLPDGTLYEAYSLNTFGAGELSISVSTADFAPAIFVRTSDGSAVAAGDSAVTATVDGDTRYTIVVATNGQQGAFQLTTSFGAADGETCRAVKKLSGDDTVNGAISVDSCTATLPASAVLAYYDYYDVALPAAGVLDVSVESTDFAATVSLLDDGGNAIASDIAGPESSEAQLRVQVPAGRYTLQVRGTIPSGGAYRLRDQLTPGAPQPCGLMPATPGDGPSGVLSAASCRTGLGLADLYSMPLPAAGTLELNLTSDALLNGILAVRDSKDNLVLVSEDLQSMGATHLSVDLPAGAYTVAAGARSGSGFYQMTSTFTAHEIPGCTAVQPLDINGGYVQKLGPGSCRGANGGFVDYYEFTLPSDAAVAMILTSSELDGYLTLTDSAGKVLRSDDNSYGYGDPLIIQYLSAGTYRLAARAASGTPGGLYEVDVRSAMGARPPFCGVKATIPLGGSVSGTIDFAGCQYPDAAFADIYKIEVTGSATLDVRVESSAFDAQTLLLDAKGNLVDRDDDSGGGTNARINRLVAPGAYYVVAKPVSDYRSSGAYTVSVQAELQPI